MTALMQDLRFALRGFAKSPTFTVVVVLTLALGIGANVAIFSLMDQLLFRPLPVPSPERLVVLDAPGPFSGSTHNLSDVLTPLSHEMFQEIRDRNEVFSGVLAHYPAEIHLTVGDETEDVHGDLVSGTFFDVLGVKPAVGRLFTARDDITPGSHPFVVLGYSYWSRRFAGRADVVGETVLVNGHPMTVIGVSPTRLLRGRGGGFGRRLRAPHDATTGHSHLAAGAGQVGNTVAHGDGPDPRRTLPRRGAGGGERFVSAASPNRCRKAQNEIGEFSRAVRGKTAGPASRGTRHVGLARCLGDATPGAHGDGGPGAGYRLRECGEPFAGPGHDAGQGARPPDCPGCESAPARAPAAGGEYGPRRRRRCSRDPPRHLDRRPPSPRASLRARVPGLLGGSRSTNHALCRHRLSAHRARLRNRTLSQSDSSRRRPRRSRTRPRRSRFGPRRPASGKLSWWRRLLCPFFSSSERGCL